MARPLLVVLRGAGEEDRAAAAREGGVLPAMLPGAGPHQGAATGLAARAAA